MLKEDFFTWPHFAISEIRFDLGRLQKLQKGEPFMQEPSSGDWWRAASLRVDDGRYVITIYTHLDPESRRKVGVQTAPNEAMVSYRVEIKLPKDDGGSYIKAYQAWAHTLDFTSMSVFDIVSKHLPEDLLKLALGSNLLPADISMLKGEGDRAWF